MQLFLLKRGGEEIYVGPLGHESTHLINYFEVINKTVIITLPKLFLKHKQTWTEYSDSVTEYSRNQQDHRRVQSSNLDA